jgi:hypothetical protein
VLRSLRVLVTGVDRLVGRKTLPHGVSATTVVLLRRDGYVMIDDRGVIKLTDKGTARVEGVTRLVFSVPSHMVDAVTKAVQDATDRHNT